MLKNFDIDYRKIATSASVVVYGAGKYGKYIADKVIRKTNAKVLAFIDINYSNKCNYLKNEPIIGLDQIPEYMDSTFVIAISDKQAANEARSELIRRGISDEKIIEGEYCDFWDNIDCFELIKYVERLVDDKNPNIYIFMLPEHGNTGDYLIGYAEQLFFEMYFPKLNIRGVTTLEWINLKEFFIRIINNNDLICINGGGFWGNLRGDDAVYKDIIESFPNNKKIFMPNSLTYDRQDGDIAFLNDVEWINKQEGVHVFFREKNSYLKMKECYKYSYLAPDMALLVDIRKREKHKNGKVLLCLRDDCERVMDIGHLIKQKLDNSFIEYDFFDIYIDEYVGQNDGKKLVQYVIDKFSDYECIITDRLHGMLISTIASVPCLAFDNITNKLSGVYEWIKEYEYIKMLNYEDIENLENYLKDVCDIRKWKEYRPLLEDFNQMADIIGGIVEGDSV